MLGCYRLWTVIAIAIAQVKTCKVSPTRTRYGQFGEDLYVLSVLAITKCLTAHVEARVRRGSTLIF